MRVAPDAFTSLPLRCHALLNDVPLHDVWAIALEGGGPGRTVADVQRIVFDPERPASNMALRALFGLRRWLGRLFGWDEERHDALDQSYANRLTSADRDASLVPPGTEEGSFRVLFSFASEAVSEIRNATVHAFLVRALVPSSDGYTLFLAIYVKPVGRLTGVYMAMIDPFRRRVVYPALGRHAQREWSRRYRSQELGGDVNAATVPDA